jgi:hypothetical protein
VKLLRSFFQGFDLDKSLTGQDAVTHIANVASGAESNDNVSKKLQKNLMF